MDIVSAADSDDGEEKAIFGIFIKNVVPDSPAGNCGELHVSCSCIKLLLVLDSMNLLTTFVVGTVSNPLFMISFL